MLTRENKIWKELLKRKIIKDTKELSEMLQGDVRKAIKGFFLIAKYTRSI